MSIPALKRRAALLPFCHSVLLPLWTNWRSWKSWLSWTGMKNSPIHTAAGATVLQLAATLLGIAVAVLTRSGSLPDLSWLSKPVLCLLHLAIMALWTVAWLLFWANALGHKGGWLLAIAVPVVAAVFAEVAQVCLPGHTYDWAGQSANLLGAILVLAEAGRRVVAVEQ